MCAFDHFTWRVVFLLVFFCLVNFYFFLAVQYTFQVQDYNTSFVKILWKVLVYFFPPPLKIVILYSSCFFLFLARVITTFLPCQFLIDHPLIHIKDKARCRIFSQLQGLSHCLVSHRLFQYPPPLCSFILNLSLLFYS